MNYIAINIRKKIKLKKKQKIFIDTLSIAKYEYAKNGNDLMLISNNKYDVKGGEWIVYYNYSKVDGFDNRLRLITLIHCNHLNDSFKLNDENTLHFENYQCPDQIIIMGDTKYIDKYKNSAQGKSFPESSNKCYKQGIKLGEVGIGCSDFDIKFYDNVKGEIIFMYIDFMEGYYDYFENLDIRPLLDMNKKNMYVFNSKK